MKESNINEEISIKVQTLDNTYSFKVIQNWTISKLKEEIFKKFKIPKERQRLIFQGKYLKEDEKLINYKITDGCVIQLIAKSLEQNNNNSQMNNRGLNEVYPIIQIPFRSNRRRRRVVMPHFDISEYLEGFYQNLISLDNYNKCKNNFSSDKNLIEVFDFSKSTYEVGEWVDVKDTINQWLEAQVIKVQKDKAYVHYNGWGTRWDEWIEFSSPRMRNFKTYTLQTPLAFSVSPYPAIPCDSNIEQQERPIDIFYYIEKTKNHMENLLGDINKLLDLRKKNSPLFTEDKFDKDNFEILFKATQMIPFLDRVGKMLSDISLVLSHFVVNPNYYSSFLFGYKRQDLFNEINKIKINKNNIVDDKLEGDNTINKDTQTPPLENKFLKKMQSQSQKTEQSAQNQKSKKISPDNRSQVNIKNIKENSNKTEDIKEKNINNDSKKNKIIDNKNKIEDKKDNKNINNDKDKIKKEKENKNIDKEAQKDLKNKNEKIKGNSNEEEENHLLYHRHNSYSAPSISEEENSNTANFQRQRQRISQEEILPNQIATNLGYDLSFSSYELPFIQRVVYSYTSSDRIISPFSPFYQIFSNKKLFPRVNLQVPTMLPPGEVIMMTGYSPFPETNLDIYIHTIAPSNPNENRENNNHNSNNNSNNQENNNININTSNNSAYHN